MLPMLLKNGTRQGGNDEICVIWGSWVDGDGDGTTTTSMSSLPPSSPRDWVGSNGCPSVFLTPDIINKIGTLISLIKGRLVPVDKEVGSVNASELVGVFGQDSISKISDFSTWRKRDEISGGAFEWLTSSRVQEQKPKFLGSHNWWLIGAFRHYQQSLTLTASAGAMCSVMITYGAHHSLLHLFRP